MHEVHTFTPHCHTCNSIKLGTCRTTWKAEILQRKMAFKYKCVDTAMKVGNLTKLNGTCYVGGSIKILCSAIKQKEAFWTQWHIGIGCWLIMNYRSMLLVSGYCVERLILEQWLLGTQLTQLGTNRQLGLATFWYCLLKPF